MCKTVKGIYSYNSEHGYNETTPQKLNIDNLCYSKKQLLQWISRLCGRSVNELGLFELTVADSWM